MDGAFTEGKEETRTGFFSGKRGGEAAGWCGFPSADSSQLCSPSCTPPSPVTLQQGQAQPLPARSMGADALGWPW